MLISKLRLVCFDLARHCISSFLLIRIPWNSFYWYIFMDTQSQSTPSHEFHASMHHPSPLVTPSRSKPLYIPTASTVSNNGASTQSTRGNPTHDIAQNTEFAFSMLTADVFENAVRLSEPIESSPEDDALLIDALCRNERLGLNYSTAFESLHGVSGICLWRDHHL